MEINNPKRSKTKRELELELIEIRRNRCLELHMSGLTQQAIGKSLNISQASVSLDIAAIREEAKERLNHVIEKELPLQWLKTRTAIQFMQRESLRMFYEAKTDNTKLAALQAFGNAQKEEFELCANSTVIDEALKFVSNNNLKEVLTQLGNNQKK
jgi:hypothetical protein